MGFLRQEQGKTTVILPTGFLRQEQGKTTISGLSFIHITRYCWCMQYLEVAALATDISISLATSSVFPATLDEKGDSCFGGEQLDQKDHMVEVGHIAQLKESSWKAHVLSLPSSSARVAVRLLSRSAIFSSDSCNAVRSRFSSISASCPRDFASSRRNSRLRISCESF